MPYDNLYRKGWKQFNVRLSTEAHEALAKLAKQKGRSMVKLARAAIMQYIIHEATTEDK